MWWFGALVMAVGVAVITSGVGRRVLVDPECHRAIARGAAVMVVGAALLVLDRVDEVSALSPHVARQGLSVLAAVIASSAVLVRFSQAPVGSESLSPQRSRAITARTRLSQVGKAKAAGEG
jgi:hypothetical protein